MEAQGNVLPDNLHILQKRLKKNLPMNNYLSSTYGIYVYKRKQPLCRTFFELR